LHFRLLFQIAASLLRCLVFIGLDERHSYRAILLLSNSPTEPRLSVLLGPLRLHCERH
jgi:hypothetical protein